MDENLNVMIPVSILRDSFNCSAHLYDSKELLIEKYNASLSLAVNETTALFDKEELELDSPMIYKAGEYYVPMEVISRELGYSYNWDINENTVTVANTSGETNILPSAYDLREKERSSPVKDQGARGTCWAFGDVSFAGGKSCVITRSYELKK